MSRRTLTLLLASVLSVVLSAGAVQARVPYVALGPGPTYDTLGEVDLFGAFGSAGTGALAALLLVFSLLLADFFDTMGTMVAVGAEGGLLDKNGNPPNSDKILMVDSVAAIAARFAPATSSTCTKSRRCAPSSNTRGASPRARAERNSDATPA